MRKHIAWLIGLTVTMAGLPALAAPAFGAVSTSVRITAAPTSAASGRSFALAAKYSASSSARYVQLERRLSAKSRWSRVKRVAVSGSAITTFSATTRLGTNQFRARLLRANSTQLAMSKVVSVKGTILVAPVMPSTGKIGTYSGTLPVGVKRSVLLQVASGKRWRTVARTTSKSSGAFSVKAVFKAPSVKVRIDAPKTKKRKHYVSASQSVTVLLTPDTKQDADHDSLPDFIEQKLGTLGKATKDFDGDGLTDAQELKTTTSPILKDTDHNGKRDDVDDLDKDGISNKAEVVAGTLAYEADSDNDDLADGKERAHKTDPLKADTDGDGVNDGTEVTLGSNPLSADSDGDGTKDGAESYGTEVKGDGATLEATGSAEAVASAAVESTDQFDDIDTDVLAAVDVTSDEELSEGTLSIPFDTSSLDDSADIKVLHFDEDTGTFDVPDDQSVNLATGVATVTTTQFSPFVVADLNQLKAVWSHEIVEPRDPSSTVKSIDAMLAIDSSGSMQTTDPSDNRKAAAKSFVDSLLTGDRAGALDFDDGVEALQPLTSDFTLVKSLIDSVDSDGGTDIGAAVRGALDELDKSGDSTHGRVIVLLTDGDGDYDSTLTSRAANSKTTIYTVGLGDGASASLLQSIADGTGGKYIQVSSAADLAGAYNRITEDLGAPDSDGDGLSDETETAGWPTQRGNFFKTNPNKADTDGDGLSDGFEAGKLTTGKLGRAYAAVSSPLETDGDHDGLSDPDEIFLDSNPAVKDSDADGLNDAQEIEFGSDPSTSNEDGDIYDDLQEYQKKLDPLSYDLGPDEAKAAFLGGAIYGDWTWGAKNVGGMNDEQMQSLEYIGGQLASGVAVIGDIRDIITNLGKGDFVQAALSGVGFVPVAGDVASVGAKLAKFASKGAKAEKAAFRAVEKLKISSSLKKAIVAKVFGTGAKVFPKALEGGAKDVVVYLGKRDGKVVYVGITNNFDRRALEHGDRFTLQRMSSVKMERGKARAIEQLIISKHPEYLNKINSISPNHEYYSEALSWAKQWLKDQGISY